MGRSKGPDKNKDAEGKLTRAGVAANKATRQLEKAETAAANSLGGANRTGLQAGDAYAGLSANLNAAGSNQNFNQRLGQNYLDSYNTLKDQKNKSRNELAQLGNMNRQMGYNPTTGMGIGQSANFNTIGAGRDIRNLMNNPLVKMAGMATNPLGFAGSMLGKNLYQNFTDEDDDTGFFNAAGRTLQDVTPFDTDGVTNYLSGVGQNLSTDFRNTANALSDFQQAPNISTGLSGLYNNFINSLNTGEEETYDGPFPVQKPDAFMQAYNEDMNGVSPYGATDGTFREKIINPVTDYVSSFKSDATLGDLQDSYSNYGGDFNALNFQPGVDQSNEITVTPGFRPNVVTYGGGLPVTYGTSDDDIMQGGYVGYSGTGPNSVDFNTMGQPFDRQNRNQGGLIPPMSGPMSNGIGNLFKMK